MNKKKLARKQAPKKPLQKKRMYDNSARQQQSESNKTRIIEKYVELLVEKRGDEISLEELAEKAEVSARTLYRFFGDKKSLSNELEIYLNRYLTSVNENVNSMSIDEFTAFSFKIFDKYSLLLQSYLYTNFGQASRRIFRKKLNELLLEKIKAQSKNKNIEEKKALFIVSLISANIWSDLKDIHQISGEEIATTAQWAVKTLLSGL